MIEALERRTFFTVTPDPGADFAHAFNVGDLNGEVTLGDAVGPNDQADVYEFTMPRAGMFFGRIRATDAPAEIRLFQQQVDNSGQTHVVLLDFRVANQDGPDAGFASGDLSPQSLTAGNYFMFVTPEGPDTSYLIRMTADFAGNTLAAARDIGSVTDNSFQDFIGQFPTPSLTDLFDTYKFKMDAAGVLNVDFSLDSTDASLFQAHIALINDMNHDNAIEPGETLITTSPGTTSTINMRIDPGTYILRITSDLNFSNYHLHLNADYAGSTPGDTRDMGSLNAGKSFNDFISATTDPLDQYKFSVGATRPLFLAYSASGDAGLTDVTLFKDTNNDGVAEPSERLDAAIEPSFSTILLTIDAGNYIVQVQAESGEGTYTLFGETRPDGAGNTLAAAKNLGNVNGLTHLDDYVSDADPVDFYKFTATAAGTVGASLFSEFGGDADLVLIKDANNNGVIDKNELLAAATLTSSGAKELSKSISAGNYFLRVTNKLPDSVAKYFLTFHTDYAGGTVATARNVGTLNGTVGFDDWASGPFSGAVSDRNDLYKLTLATAKKFTAKLTGTLEGEDLKLLLYRDKNNDGKLTDDEIITVSNVANSPNELITRQLAAGTYYVRVWGVNGETNYHLALTAS
jgi:hypothetical protein